MGASIYNSTPEQNNSFENYSKDKSRSNLTILRNSRSNLKKKKEEAKTIWVASRVAILEKIKERNDSFGKYFKEKSLSNLTILRNSRSNLKKKKEEAKTIWIASRVAELENMDVDPCTSWKAAREIAEGLYGHHKNIASMKMKKPKGYYCTNDLENAEVFKNFYSKLYNNHKGTKYDETILNEIDEQPEKPM